jgi:hypothetical protein
MCESSIPSERADGAMRLEFAALFFAHAGGRGNRKGLNAAPLSTIANRGKSGHRIRKIIRKT